MTLSMSKSRACLPHLTLLGIAFGMTCSALLAQNVAQKTAEQTLVRFNITTEIVDSSQSPIDLAGKVVPKGLKIIEAYPGIVADDKDHVLALLGDGWGNIRALNPRIEITDPDGRRFPAKFVGIDQSMRIAVAQCQKCGLTKTPVCESCEIKNGTTVIVPTLEGPTMSQFERAQLIAASTKGNNSGPAGWAIKVSRPLCLVGAPLVDKHEIIGVVTDQDAQLLPSDITVLTISQVLGSARRIIATRRDIQTGWLGVSPVPYPDPGTGVTIAGIEEDSPAYRAGLLPGDVMVKWNGIAVPDQRKLMQMIQDASIGSKAAIEVQRQGKPVTLTAVIGPRNSQDSQNRMVLNLQDLLAIPGAQITSREVPFQSSFGIDTMPLTPQLAAYFEVPVQALLVSGVARQTAFDLAGVRAGDVILGIDGTQVSDPEAFYQHIRSRGWGSRLTLRLVRKGAEMNKTVQLPKAQEGKRQPQATFRRFNRRLSLIPQIPQRLLCLLSDSADLIF